MPIGRTSLAFTNSNAALSVMQSELNFRKYLPSMYPHLGQANLQPQIHRQVETSFRGKFTIQRTIIKNSICFQKSFATCFSYLACALKLTQVTTY